MNTELIESLQTFSSNDRRELVLKLIETLGTASTEVLSVLTGLCKPALNKVLRSLSGHSRISVSTCKKVIYWSCSQ